MASFAYDNFASRCAEDPADGEMPSRRRQTSSQLQSRAGGHSNYEMTMHAFGCPHDIDAERGRRLRQSADKTSCGHGAASADIARRGIGLSERRLRGAPFTADGSFGCLRPSMLAVNSGLEAFDIDACCRHRRLSPAAAREDDGDLKGRAFFDHIYHAERYAELLGRPVVSSRRREQSLLENPDALPMWWEGDEDDASTSASGEQDHEPSPEVRQVLKALLPASGEIDIPMKMVARLETLVGLAERVDAGRRLLDRLDCSHMSTPRTATPPSSPEMNSQGQPETSASEPIYPTLLRAASHEGGKSTTIHADKGDNKEPSEGKFSEASTASPESSQSNTMDKIASQRRKGFNAVVQGGGRAAWSMIH